MLTEMVKSFLGKQKKKFPHLYVNKDEEEIFNKSINTLYDLIKIDSISYLVVRDVLKWVLEDKFWHSQVTSLYTLRHKSPNGNIKFHNILTAYNKIGG